MTEVVIDRGYRPRKHQKEIHERLRRFSVLVCHRRMGKTVSMVNQLVGSSMLCQRVRPRFAYIAPLFKQAKQVSWDYLKAYTKEIPGVKTYENELRVELPGERRIQLYGADNPDAIRGIYLDGVVLDEHAQMNPRLWSEVISPLLTDRKGWAAFIGTPMGRNEFCELYENAAFGFLNDEGVRVLDPDWYGAMYKASETGIIDAKELERAAKNMTEDQYAQEFECSFEAAIAGAYYGVLMRQALEDGRITSVPHQRGISVETWWDLGHSDYTSIWFVQWAAQEIHVIDHYQNCQEDLHHYASVLQRKQQEHDYVYERHVWPHDGRVKTLGSGGKGLDEMFEELGFMVDVQPKGDVMAGINQVRTTIGRCWFDEIKCRAGIEALRQYRSEYDVNRRVFKQEPHHDWACVVGETEVLTRHGRRRIVDLPPTGEVLTPCGFKPYTNPHRTRIDAPLVRVEFADGLTVKCTPDHLFLTASGWRFAEFLTRGTVIRSTLTPLRNISMGVCTALTRAIGICRAAAESSIARHGKRRLAPCPAAVTSTIATAIRSITASTILSAWMPQSISVTPGAAGLGHSAPSPANVQPSGIGRKRVAFGTRAMPSGQRVGPSGSASQSHARGAVRKSWHWFARAVTRRNTALTFAKPRRIATVEPLSERADVWCLTVPDGGVFSLANGAVIHNSHAADGFRVGCVAGEDRRFGSWTTSELDLGEDHISNHLV